MTGQIGEELFRGKYLNLFDRFPKIDFLTVYQDIFYSVLGDFLTVYWEMFG